MSELKNKAIKGVLWSAIDKGGVKLVSFIVSVVIARILTPADYGVIGMIMVFIVIANLLIDSGFSQALVQRKDRTDVDMSTAFYFNLLIAITCYILLFALAPCIAEFYEMPILVPVLRVIGINIIIISLATVQRAKLLIDLNFKVIAIVNISAVIVSGVMGIYMAYNGYGVWALVLQQVSSYLTMTIVYWLLGRWRPMLVFSKESLVSLWNFGSKLLAAGLVATTLREVYTVTIGKFYRPTELGYYTRAVQTSDMVSITANELINAVTFPILSSLQDDRDRMVSVYSRMLGMTAFCIMPIMTLLAVVAQPFISVLLTDKWLPVVPLLQWLCMARMFTPISSLNMNILNAIGRSDLFLKIDLAKLPLTILTMIITIPLGVKAIVIGNLIWTALCYFINAYLPGRLFGFGVKAQFRIFYKIVIATAIMAMVTTITMTLISTSIAKLLIGCVTAILIYLLASFVLKINEFQEIKSIIISKFRK
ncbi:MAG: lipopolysaccharide biosynthesis protein [Duncaniella sp.]|nr:lipopolysaccharide biosynthesis protein [Duncaniella sp.]